MTVYIVAGIGTDVGKTIVASILTVALQADYWKPIAAGSDPDHHRVASLVEEKAGTIHPPVYSFRECLSPHHAARLEQKTIDSSLLRLPATQRDLVVEMAGGVLVPMNGSELTLDIFGTWKAKWILVSRHYLGSINHTLLTVEAIKRRGLYLAGIAFNGDPNPDSESAILGFSQLTCIGRLLPESEITPQVIQKYAGEWNVLSSLRPLRPLW